jgi:hypothetical protein
MCCEDVMWLIDLLFEFDLNLVLRTLSWTWDHRPGLQLNSNLNLGRLEFEFGLEKLSRTWCWVWIWSCDLTWIWSWELWVELEPSFRTSIELELELGSNLNLNLVLRRWVELDVGFGFEVVKLCFQLWSIWLIYRLVFGLIMVMECEIDCVGYGSAVCWVIASVQRDRKII